MPPDVVLDCKRLDWLMKSGRLADALDLFDRMPPKNVVAWTSAISGCTRNGRPDAAAAMFAAMLESGVAPNDFACNAALAACAAAGGGSGDPRRARRAARAAAGGGAGGGGARWADPLR